MAEADLGVPTSAREESTSISETHLAVAKGVLDSAILEHTEAAATFNSLDTKAQNTITVAGIFLAGAFAFFRADALGAFVRVGSKLPLFLLAAVVLFLIVSVICCIRAVRVTDVPITEQTRMAETAKLMLSQPTNILTEYLVGDFFDRASEWNSIADELRSKTADKAWWIRWGQQFLAAAIVFVAVLLFYVLVGVLKDPSLLNAR